MSEEELVPFLSLFAAAVVVFLAVWYVISVVIGRRRQRLQRRIGKEDSSPSIIFEDLPGRAQPTLTARFDKNFDRMINRTGLDINTPLALALTIFCGVALGAFVFIWRYEEEPYLAIPAFLIGAAVPLLFFWWRHRAYLRTLQDQLPDALFLLARSMRAGRSIDQAIQLVGEQGVQPLAAEFTRMHQQLELGLSLSQVVQSAAARIGLVDFSVFASVLSLHRTTGGSLPVLLDRLATTTRDRNQFRRQYRAATVLGRYSAAFIVSLVAVILIWLFFFHREWAVMFFETGTGYALFFGAMALEVLGAVLLFWFLRYEY